MKKMISRDELIVLLKQFPENSMVIVEDRDSVTSNPSLTLEKTVINYHHGDDALNYGPHKVIDGDYNEESKGNYNYCIVIR